MSNKGLQNLRYSTTKIFSMSLSPTAMWWTTLIRRKDDIQGDNLVDAVWHFPYMGRFGSSQLRFSSSVGSCDWLRLICLATKFILSLQPACTSRLVVVHSIQRSFWAKFITPVPEISINPFIYLTIFFSSHRLLIPFGLSHLWIPEEPFL